MALGSIESLVENWTYKISFLCGYIYFVCCIVLVSFSYSSIGISPGFSVHTEDVFPFGLFSVEL
jgi:glycogen synthase